MSLCGLERRAIHGQFREGGLGLMAQWTSAVGAAQLARLLTSQQDRPAGPGSRRPPAYRALAAGIRLLVLQAQVLREAAPRLAYVVADFHNPTGALADEDQRRRLVEAARSAGTVLVVDETMGELYLEEGLEMPRPVSTFDPAGSTVITVGSASKAFWAGMRIGWVRAAPDVIRSLVAARAYADLGTPVLEQLAVNWLLSTGGW